MMEKVKLTREQAEAVESYKTQGHNLAVFVANSKGFHNQYESLKILSVDEMGRLLYEPDSYEVEEEYKVGDWVKDEDGCWCVVHEIKDGSVWGYWSDRPNRYMSYSFQSVVLMTPEEIKAEQERRVWKKIGREVGEFRERDSGFTYDGRLVPGYAALNEIYKAGSLKGFYPAESFISFGGGEE